MTSITNKPQTDPRIPEMPDLPSIADNIAKFGDNPNVLHFQSATKALQYLKRTVGPLVAYGGGTVDLKQSARIGAENAKRWTRGIQSPVPR